MVLVEICEKRQIWASETHFGEVSSDAGRQTDVP